MNKFYLLFLLSIPLQSFADNKNHVAGARSDGMGKASVALVDNWSGFHNQAALAKLQQKSFGVYYENRFGIKELSTKSFRFNFPAKNLGSFGANYTQFGFSNYKETKTGLSYSRALGKKFWAGLQFNQHQKKLNQNYGSQTKYSFELGLLTEIFPNVQLGFHLFNPTQTQFKTWEYDDKIPTIIRFGCSWQLSNGTILSSEIQKGLNEDLQIKGGLEHPVGKQLFLRAGAYNHPNVISIGLGFSFDFLKADIAFSRHPVLGYTPSIDLNFSFGNTQ